MNAFITDSYDKVIKEENKKRIDFFSKETNEEWKNINFVVNSRGKNKISLLFNRCVKPFYYSFLLFLQRKKYKKLVFWQQFFGLIYCFYCRLFHIKKKNKIYIITFIYKEKNGFIGRLYYKFIKYILDGGYIDKIIVFSNYECSYYSNKFSINKNIFQFVHLGIPKKSDFQNSTNCNNRFIAVGRSNRDYDFLINSLKGEKYNIDILCNDYKNDGKSNNIKIYNDVFGEKYTDMLKKSFAVIIPLKNENISSGQLVILQSMMCGKPIIITKSNTIDDYISNNKNGLIIEKNKRELINAMNLLMDDNDLYTKISNMEIKMFNDRFTEENMLKEIAKICMDR